MKTVTRTAGEAAQSEQRITVSSVPMSRVPMSRERETREGQAHASMLERLVVAACESPVKDGEEAVVHHFIETLGEVFPEAGVGACLVPAPASHSSPDLSRPAPVEQQVWRSLPEGEEQRAEGRDPTRLFPGYAYERVLAAETHGTTLHVACDDPSIDEEGSSLLVVAERAARLLGRNLELARNHAKATNDARDLRALSSHMVQAEKLASLGQIAAGVVHELNNPLTSIVAYTDWLLRKAGPNGEPDSVERLRRIGESASRILRFTRDLVAYARPSSEVPVPVAVHSVLDQALAFCEHVLAEHGAKVERAYGELMPVKGMPEQLAQVFVNLFTNACHAMPADGGQLRVATSLDAARERVVIVVDDNGHGISAEHAAQIFVPFFTTKVDGRGTGLGLSIVKNIVDGHGGDIRAERGALGGARFVLTFPVMR